MTELSLTILPETPKDAQAIERLHERTFGPGRFVLSAYRLREHAAGFEGALRRSLFQERLERAA